MVRTGLYLIVIFLIALPLFSTEENTIAVIKSFEGAILIEKEGQVLEPRVYLALTPGTTIRIPNSAHITLFLFTGVKATFADDFFLEITEWGVRGLDAETKEYLSRTENKTVYSRKDTLSSRGFDPEITEEIKAEINRIEAEINDPILKALLKGDVYKSFNLKKSARKEFLTHKKLLEEQADRKQ